MPHRPLGGGLAPTNTTPRPPPRVQASGRNYLGVSGGWKQGARGRTGLLRCGESQAPRPENLPRHPGRGAFRAPSLEAGRNRPRFSPSRNTGVDLPGAHKNSRSPRARPRALEPGRGRPPSARSGIGIRWGPALAASAPARFRFWVAPPRCPAPAARPPRCPRPPRAPAAAAPDSLAAGGSMLPPA